MTLTNKTKIFKSKIFLCVYGAWGMLGFTRGYLKYKYEHKSYSTKLERFYYTNAVLESFISAGVYINPFFLPFTIFKEAKRLEIILRNLEED